MYTQVLGSCLNKYVQCRVMDDRELRLAGYIEPNIQGMLWIGMHWEGPKRCKRTVMLDTESA